MAGGVTGRAWWGARVRGLCRVLSALVCCASAAAAQRGAAPSRADSLRADSLRAARERIIPPGLGTLRQEEIALVLQVQGLVVTALPLDETVIRVLAPDSYTSLRANRDVKTRALDSVRTRLGLGSVQVWYVTFANSEAGEARYDADDLLIRSGGRDYRPLRVLPLKAGFGDGRLAQRARQSALYAFDPTIDLTQPLSLTVGAATTTAWGDIAQRIDRERALIWSRAATPRP